MEWDHKSLWAKIDNGERMEMMSFDAVDGWNKKLSNNGGSSVQSEETESSSWLVGLKLGKRTYFEDAVGGNGAVRSASSVRKKKRVPQQDLGHPRCQVEGCNLDLSAAKEYHQKHRVCVVHTKSPSVVVAGVECRFCQQCSRFHGLSEFDQMKRSCRRRLWDHNARRRKPQAGPFLAGSSPFSKLGLGTCEISSDIARRVGSSCCSSAVADFRQQKIHLLEGKSPYSHVWSSGNSSKNFAGDPFSPNQEQTVISDASFPNGPPDHRRALSLLSNGSCCPPEVRPAHHAQFSNVPAPATSIVNHQAPLADQPYGVSLDFCTGGDMQDFDASFDYGKLHCQ